MRTDEQQCLSMKTVLTVGLTYMYDRRTRDCLYDESRPVRYEGCCSLTALYQKSAVGDLV